MKALSSMVAIGIMLSAACYAQHCSDPNSRRAEVGGSAINGWAGLQQRPLKDAKVRLLSNSKTIWVGSTDRDGWFHIKGLLPGTYRLTVTGWGSTTIRINSDLTKQFGEGQMPYYSLLLVDNECIETITTMN